MDQPISACKQDNIIDLQHFQGHSPPQHAPAPRMALRAGGDRHMITGKRRNRRQ
jgi:hypothetical protein